MQIENDNQNPTVHSVRDLPSAQELKAIFEASELYKSNTFKLQIDQLLPSVVPKKSASARTQLESFLFKLHDHLMNISSKNHPRKPLEEAKRLKASNIAVPFPSPGPTEETQWTFKFEKPDSITLVGSWANEMSVKHKDEIPFGVDVSIAIPESTIQEKDYLNDRFFHKRALYLANIAASISGAFEVDLSYESPSEDVRQTFLVVTPREGASYDWSKLHAVVRIILTLPSASPIPKNRFSPTSSNLRIADQSTAKPMELSPTPHYNHLLALSQVPAMQLIALHHFQHLIPQFSRAVSLLRVWANQRGFGKGKSSVRGFESLGSWWGFLIGFLVEGEEPIPNQEPNRKRPRSKMKLLGKGLSSYQLFRGALDFLSTHDFSQEPIFMKTTDGHHKYPPETWTSSGEPIFIDPSSTFNLLEGVPYGSLCLLKQDATQTLKALNNLSGDSFTPTFLRDLREPQSRFDVTLRVNFDGIRAREEDRLRILDQGSYLRWIFNSLDRILSKALGNRAVAITFIVPCPHQSRRSLSHPQPDSSSYFDLGVLLNPEHAFRVIDRGPKVDDDPDSIQAFREFWGEKAELRRFADGSITECVVWEMENKSEIPSKILEYVLQRHYHLKKIRNFKSMCEKYSQLPSIAQQVSPSTSMNGWKLAIEAFNELVKRIKEMELPLALVSCLPCAEELRHTSTFTPSPIPLSRIPALPECTRFLPVYEAVLQFEKSARWPDDLGAIQKVKFAWLERIAVELIKTISGCQAVIAIDELASPIEDGGSLEVGLPSGFSFRLRIYHDREKTLLENIASDKTTPAFQKVLAEKAMTVHLYRFIHSPRHHSLIMNMHHRHPGYSSTVRLVKRWLASHLLSNHVYPELVELICAYVFLRPDSQRQPIIGSTGFLRTLNFLQQWNWRQEPLLIPIESIAGLDETVDVHPDSDKVKIAESAFQERRKLDPGMSSGAWHIATDTEPKGVFWCLEGRGPSPMIADRVKMLADASSKCVEQGMNERGPNMASLFMHPLSDYDFLIHLDPSVLPRYIYNIFPEESVWSKEVSQVNIKLNGNSDSGVMFGFDPAKEFLDDLQRVYGQEIAFFYDALGGTVIAGSWNPLIREARPFRALLGYSSKPQADKKKGHVVLNEDAILEEIARMGQGMIKEIVKQSY
ncbi:Nrap protein [Serendipita vermifera]|nr:Nrap protein [Serendipita vermifera]